MQQWGDYRIKGKSGIIVLCDRITSNVVSFMRKKKKIGERRGKTAPHKAKEKISRLKKTRRSSARVKGQWKNSMTPECSTWVAQLPRVMLSL